MRTTLAIFGDGCAASSARQLVAYHLQQLLVKTGGHLVKHARYYWLLLTESHLTQQLFGSLLSRIVTLPVPTG
ncbi:MAG TPA: hypothetical protein VKB84_00355 [Candidatus Binataceae bacterium]|nr:hypothetical protein [Candidatus Binataceae bacterium]